MLEIITGRERKVNFLSKYFCQCKKQKSDLFTTDVVSGKSRQNKKDSEERLHTMSWATVFWEKNCVGCLALGKEQFSFVEMMKSLNRICTEKKSESLIFYFYCEIGFSVWVAIFMCIFF